MMAVLLGLTVAASFGPVNLLLTQCALTDGLRAAVPFAAGASFGDFLLLALGLLVGKQIVSTYAGSVYLGVALILAGASLIVLALIALWRSRKGLTMSIASRLRKSIFVSALAVTVLNPMGILMWLTAGSVVMNAKSQLTYVDEVSRGLFMLSGDAAWFVGWTAVICSFRKIFRPSYLRVVGRLAYVTICLIGLWTVLEGVRRLAIRSV